MIIDEKIKIDDLVGLQELYDGLINKKSDIEDMKLLLKEINEDRNYYLIVARDESNIIVGTLSGIICKDLTGDCTPFMVLENVVVKESMRNRGIGKKLIIHIENLARTRGCRYINFTSTATRTSAHKFYQSVGYELDYVKGFKKYI